ncbi:Sodium:solute symporter family protein [Streptomyces sp. 1222.5]|uniref:sodium/solute symporter n=1 Tax=unclassified Streptomyces TaxID=2593676 RepID=UPI000895D894|nr:MULTISPECIES: cation acetate symporter [unclassified Streptomyces]PKW11948.1 sodium:solute symporter family protein [Streptomyces sp. 5112.2]SEB66138.1 Sodium:solute symporter family protein [Streptomyces sp. 1222.5]
MNQTYGIVAVSAAVVATLVIGSTGLRISRTTSDFYVASRTVPPYLNAMAVSGEYLSAASFLGIAGLVAAQGVDMLWFPVGYTAGYLVLLAFVAAPLRRSGAYTLPDFAESRLESRAARRVASVLVVGVGWLYLLPQLQGAGLTLGLVTGAPRELGGVLVAVVVTLAVAAGGMRGITFVQAFQYCLKLAALLVPALFLAAAWHGDPSPGAALDEPPTFRRHTVVTVDSTVRLRIAEPLRADVTGTVDDERHDGGRVSLGPGVHEVRAGTTLRFPPDTPVPERDADGGWHTGASSWATPLSGGRDDHPLYTTYGLICATFLGTMGLPHVLVRFYTNPDGRAARRTTVIVLALVGGFYLLPPLYGLLGRVYAPDLLLTGNTDAAVLVLSERLVGGVVGDLLGALIAAGACAAFLSTASGLTLSVAGVLSQDVLPSLGVRHFRLATLLAIAVPTTASAAVSGLPVANAVGLAFAVAASSFCPLLVLGIWWRGLTAPGAIAGLLTGGGSALTAVALTIAGPLADGWAHTLLAWPAVWSVPLGFLTMILVSLATRHRIPAGTEAAMARLHLPERAAARGAHQPPGATS